MNIWLNSQLQAIKLVLSRFRAHFSSTCLIALAIGVTISLPGLFYLAVNHVSQLSNIVHDGNELSVFVAIGTPNHSVQEIDATLAQHPQVSAYRFVSKTEAWANMQNTMQTEGGGDVTDLLTENPLPDAFYVKGRTNDPELLSLLKKDLAQMPNIDHVLLNTEWSQRLATILDVAKKIIFFIALLLSIGLIIIIGNTIRMQIMTQRDEIEVSYLIGATNSFIRTPFLYTGVFYGFFGGIIALIIMFFSANRFNHFIANLSVLYDNDLSLAKFDNSLILTVFLIAIMIGWIAAHFAVNRALANIIHAYTNK